MPAPICPAHAPACCAVTHICLFAALQLLLDGPPWAAMPMPAFIAPEVPYSGLRFMPCPAVPPQPSTLQYSPFPCPRAR